MAVSKDRRIFNDRILIIFLSRYMHMVSKYTSLSVSVSA